MVKLLCGGNYMTSQHEDCGTWVLLAEFIEVYNVNPKQEDLETARGFARKETQKQWTLLRADREGADSVVTSFKKIGY